MNKTELKGLKIYLISMTLVIGLYVYAGVTGWKFINSTNREHTAPGSRSTFYHK